MNVSEELDFMAAERQRIQLEYARRSREISPDTYAPWQPSPRFEIEVRNRKAATMLQLAGLFPNQGDQCLEVGFGSLGWLGELISWGLGESDLHGVELDPLRAAKARQALPSADLRVGDATELPWDENSFQIVIASTVFTSILDNRVREMVAKEITRVLAPGGALLWYDFAVNNPRNPHVRKVDRRELKELFPQLSGEIKSVTLAPPIARFIAPKSWVLANILEAIPFLRTHLMGVLVKKWSEEISDCEIRIADCGLAERRAKREEQRSEVRGQRSEVRKRFRIANFGLRLKQAEGKS
jgi:ubiquinone/menaquinone biosynthesis C-methylase UbiE